MKMKNSKTFSQKKLIFSILTYGAFSINTLLLANDAKIKFTENKGQLCDQNNAARPDILFYGSAPGQNFYIKKNGISYQMYKVEKWKEVEDKNPGQSIFSYGKRMESVETKVCRIDVDLINTNSNATFYTDLATDDYTNFYNVANPKGITNVKSYNGLTLKNIYDGIDLKWYEKNGNLEYDYLLKAGVDYKKIKINISGADLITIGANGELILKTEIGEIIEPAPLAFQNGKILKSTWVKADNVLSFNIEGYDEQFPLIIDPLVLSKIFGTYFGGFDSDLGRQCFTDSLDNVYHTGQTKSLTKIATSGAYQNTLGGNYDCFIAKFNSLGNLLWSTYYGGEGDDFIGGSGCIKNNYLYLTGSTSSTVNIASPSGFQAVISGTADAFVVKFDLQGNKVWGTYYGGPDYEGGSAVNVDSKGNIFLFGQTSSTTGIASAGAYQTTNGGVSTGTLQDVFLVKFNASGVRQWATYYGGTYGDGARDAALDVNENIYILGRTNDPLFYFDNTSIASYKGGADGFIVKFTANGIPSIKTYYGGNYDDDLNRIKIDKQNQLYIAGYTGSNAGIILQSAHQSSFTTTMGPSGYIAKLDLNNNMAVKWATYYSGDIAETADVMEVDKFGDVYFGGLSISTKSIATNGCFQDNSGQPGDAYLVKINGTSGARVWGTYLCGDGNDRLTGIAIDTKHSIYVSGITNSTNNIAYGNSYQSVLSTTATVNLLFDSYLMRLDEFGVTDLTIGINENTLVDAAFSIYPNPAKDGFSFKLKNKSSQINKVEIYDSLGKLVFDQEIFTENYVPTKGFLSGIYFCKITTNNNEKYTTKIFLLD
jgi:hypothetical protein